MRPLSEQDILSSFVNATEDEVARVALPGLGGVLWSEREYLGWRDPQSSRRGYIVHWMGERPAGIVLRAAPGGMRPGITAMCSFCHSSQPATQVRLFSAPRAGAAGRNGNTVGSYICEDLACSLLIRMALPQLNPPELIAQRAAELRERVARFTANLMREE